MVWKFYGYDSEAEYREAVSNPLQKVDLQDQEWISTLLDRLTLNGESASYRRHCIRRDGEEAWINVVMGRIINSNGQDRSDVAGCFCGAKPCAAPLYTGKP